MMTEHASLANPIELYLNKLAPSSRRTMLSYLWVFAQYLGYKKPEKYVINHNDGTTELIAPEIEWPNVSLADVSNYLEYLRTNKKSKSHETRQQRTKHANTSEREKSTIKLHLIAIKGCMRMASRHTGIDSQYKISKELLEDILSVEVRLSKSKRKDTTIDDESFQLMLSVNEPSTAAGARNQAIFHVMRYCGLRVDEVTKLMFPGSLDFANRKLSVDGKGAKERQVPMNEAVEASVCDWIDFHRGEHPGPLFTQIRKGGKLARDQLTGEISGLTPSGIDHIVNQTCKVCSLGSINTHDFRRTFATRLLQNGADTLTVAGLMGHENVDTTRAYDMRGDESKFKAIDSQ